MQRKPELLLQPGCEESAFAVGRSLSPPLPVTPPRASPPEGGSLNGNTALSLLQHHLQLPQGAPRQYPESPSMSRCPWLGLGPTLWGRSDYWDLTTGVEKMERAEVTLCWTEFLTSIIDGNYGGHQEASSPWVSLQPHHGHSYGTQELHKYINSEKPRLQTLGREDYIDALAHVARLPNNKNIEVLQRMIRALLEEAPSVWSLISILKL
ncbi:uncharacterized protein LOC128343712 [Hemicordylus capensis]|uniref:uncharacterized protein LOC128343712 n=1 Tax=Hemicordylus capensis TaxID=884348 RepID=UPI0023037BFF|nr:uncharacterized protein LOC128343712 [Hemicordylus capensis]